METLLHYIAFGAPFLVGVAFLWLAFKFFDKDKIAASSACALFAAICVFSSLPWVQGFTKTWIITNANEKFTQLGNQIDGVQKITSEMHGQLNEHQTKIDKHQTELDAHQMALGKAQADVITQQATNTIQLKQIAALQSEISTAQTTVMEQQKKIEDVEYLVNNLFAKTKTETFLGTDTNRVFSMNHGNGLWFVLLRLSHVPIAQSIQCMSSGTGGQFPLLPPFQPTRNVMGFYIRNDPSNAKYTVQYVIDSRDTNLVGTIQNVSTNCFQLDNERFLRN